MKRDNVNLLVIGAYCTAPLTSAAWENRQLSPYLQPSAVPKYLHTRLFFSLLIARGSREGASCWEVDRPSRGGNSIGTM